jgi:hypothetical protein
MDAVVMRRIEEEERGATVELQCPWYCSRAREVEDQRLRL